MKGVQFPIERGIFFTCLQYGEQGHPDYNRGIHFARNQERDHIAKLNLSPVINTQQLKSFNMKLKYTNHAFTYFVAFCTIATVSTTEVV